MITIDDFKKLDIKIGTIVEASKLEGADKLLVLKINVGEETPRQVLSGIAEYVPDITALVGTKVPVLCNLAPRMLRGLESRGMILAASNDEQFSLLIPQADISAGSKVK